MTSLRKVAVIVVNYGSSQLLEKNLAPLADTEALIVVVDNFSSNAERAQVQSLAESRGWRLVAPESNTGFGGGVNRGIAQARLEGAEDFLLLNPDARMDSASLDRLRRAASESRTTVFAPRIIDEQGRTWFNGSDVYLSDGRTMGHRRRDERPDQPRWEWLTGACLLIPEEAWTAAGGFDEEYFLYWEDVDFSRRVLLSGGRLVVAQDAIAVHDEGSTHDDRATGTRAKSPTYYYFNIRNRMLFASKHLDRETQRNWSRGSFAAAREILLRGGRRQFLRPWAPLRAAFRGVRDGRRLIR